MYNRRSDFLLPAGIYFDSAATALKARCAVDAVAAYYREECATVHRGVYRLSLQATEKYQAVREKAARFLNAAPDEIIFTKGTTEAINLVASSYGRAFLQSGDEVIITEMEHHSNIVPWQQICRERNAVLKVVPISDQGELLLDVYAGMLSSRTKIVSVAHVSNVLGTVNPIAKIADLAHACGAKVFVDGAQAAPHLPVDVQALGADFYAFSGHKAFGPTGIGILYGKRELLEAMPPYQSGGSMIERVSFEQTTFEKPPMKFEAGTPPIASVMGLGAALDYIESLGRKEIAAYEESLRAYATDKLQAIEGLRILGASPNKGPIITFTVEGAHPLDIGTFLDLKGISVRSGHLCAQPLLNRFGLQAAVRLSFAPYNTLAEIDRCVESLQEVLVQVVK